MKKAIINTRRITAVLLTVFVLGFTQMAFSVVENPKPLEFVFAGKTISGPLFTLKMNNVEAGDFLIRVKDADGNVLYTERLKGKNLSRNYQMAIDGDELYETFFVRFEITSVKTHETSIYNVTNKNRTTSEIIVAKL